MTEAAPAAGGNGGTPPAGNDNWFTGLPPEDLSYVQNRGYDKLPVKEVALQAMKAHREAEKLIGVPPNQLLHMPRDAADADGWARFDNRVGVPQDGKYDYSGVKFSDGTEIEPDFANALSTAFKANHVPKDAAKSILSEVVKIMDGSEAAEQKAAAELLDVNRQELKAQWGPRFTPNMLMAKNVVNQLGLPPEFVNQLEKAQGYVKTMETLVSLAHKIGEDQFISGGSGGDDSHVYSKESAKATLAAKQSDAEWSRKLFAGDAAVLREFNMLTSLVAG